MLVLTKSIAGPWLGLRPLLAALRNIAYGLRIQPNNESQIVAAAAGHGRLSARPGKTVAEGGAFKPGAHPLGLSSGRDGLLYVPDGYRPDQSYPLVVLLHGAGGTAQNALGTLRSLADSIGLLLLVPDSRGSTWDFILDDYGPDVAYINQALEQVFQHYSIDSDHLALAGFSDGASAALSLGVTNGDLFTHIMAFSPGFTAPASLNGKPRIFIAHGTHDAVLPIDRCSRRIVPQLKRSGYEVEYMEFDGPHTVPSSIANAGVTWFLAPAQ